ncbi:hypothetical protein NCER_101486 [Vairimorpha ceranae BRL01]|uniref:Cyclin N-terminal domain-containing protein n=2 Tax=Vairimorpha ceranae TaxID=40302 RepID=C4VA48_VAIC1|nr:hypothetical protein AAJ76_2400033428 [Vairimorpha ceranae]EEQ81907.1 hypothetical protein NCER_101486 [Vairimorpha ceranae BRL01]KAF5139627.1 hypothetical protein G9O61_00g022080 [Vairimorpha ceranae]KKO75333.1 hypothetical protein AAJ76_2400033428 [Vairimorpha ceranae]
MDHKLKSFIYTSIPDYYVVERIYSFVVKARLSLCILFNAKYIYDKYTTRQNIYDYPSTEHYSTSTNYKCNVEYDRYLLFICSTIISSKIYLDCSFTNDSWTEICHFPVLYINKVEYKILKELDYNVFMPYENLEMLYREYGEKLELHNEEKRKKRTLRRFLNLFICM